VPLQLSQKNTIRPLISLGFYGDSGFELSNPGELQRFYSLSDDELDYIVNYDIKYRMGQGIEDTDD